jgi:hypothetical protein
MLDGMHGCKYYFIEIFNQGLHTVLDEMDGMAIIEAMKETEANRISSAAAALGRKGGPARAKALSKAQRQEIAKKAAQARWEKTRAK